VINLKNESVKIPGDIYEEIRREKEDTGININRLIRNAWELYKQSRVQNELPVIETKGEINDENNL
jgi:LDH2 family malate/lactate/ureidoglycolate dehydrogenase